MLVRKITVLTYSPNILLLGQNFEFLLPIFPIFLGDLMSTNPLVVRGVSDPHTIAILAQADTYAEYLARVEIATSGRCPLCQSNGDNKPIIEREDARAWEVGPGQHVTKHFLIAPRRHVVSLRELALSEIGGMHRLKDVLLEQVHAPDYAVVVKEHDPALPRTVFYHLEMHVVVPEGTGAVSMKILKTSELTDPGSRVNDMRISRAIVFEKLRSGVPEDELTQDELALLAGL